MRISGNIIIKSTVAAFAVTFLFQLRADGVRTIDGGEWQDMTRMSLGREKTRAGFAPFDSEKAALAVLPWKSSRQISLDSDTAWKFKWAKDPDSRPKDFHDPAYDVSGWETIKVPCSWQAYGANGKGGWGTPVYSNIPYPFKADPPYVMGEPPRHYTNYDARNPVGSYRRDFEVPADWKGDRIFLKFDGVDSFYYLWVNGKYVGFTKDSRCAAEYDVTGFVKPGRNVVALEVYRYSDGSYFECQDMFRLSGIFRSCWLVRRPQVRIRDFFAKVRPEEPGKYDGDWILDVESSVVGADAGKVSLKTALYTFDDAPVVIERRGEGSFLVSNPGLWSPEEPNCYKLVLSLEQEGRTLESVSAIVGFRESRIIDGRYCLNGRKVKLLGVNRHETDPMFGHFCPRERQEEDIKLLRRANCNIVRNSHYPQDDYWYYLCNIYGIALMDEANVESHGIFGVTPREERFRKSIVWRVLNMVERNKNHPAVLFWSHGNECGGGVNFHIANDAVHARDASRPTHYESDWGASDLDSNMYPRVDTVWHRARDTNVQRPYFMCEYAHNMINAMGNLKDYHDAIDSSDVIIGGCIWDWVDQGLYKKNDKGQMIIAYGTDFGDEPNQGQFVMNGCILADRSLEPGYGEIRHVYQPAAVLALADGRSAKIVNRQFFRGMDSWDLRESVIVNGKALASRMIDVSDVGPRGEKTIAIPAAALDANRPGNSVSVRYEFIVKRAERFVEKGYVIADDQIDLENSSRAQALAAASKGDVKVEDKDGTRVFTANGVVAKFDLKAGVLASYKVNGKERLLCPMTLDAYRAPSSNEVEPAEKWSRYGWREFKATALSVGGVTSAKDAGASLEFAMETEFAGAASEELRKYGENGGYLERKGAPNRFKAPVFRAVQLWRVYADGTLTCQSEIRPQGVKRELPRIGYRFVLPLDCGKVEWFGRGPFENYRDRKSGAFRGLWNTDLAKFVMPYARPEDANNFEETDAVTLSGAKGSIGFATLGSPFAFTAIPYSAKELIDASHPPELPAPSKVEFGIYAQTRGLGGASCGPGPLKRDIIDTARDYRLDFAILPRKAETALSVPPAVLPPPPQGTGLLFRPRKLHAVSSEQGGVERASNAFDGDPDTFWHTRYTENVPDYPHSISCDLGGEKVLRGVLAFQRQDMPNGRVRTCAIETSLDGKSWTKVKECDLAAEDITEVKFASPVKARYMRFVALKPHNRSEKWASMAEIQPVFEVQ